MKTRKRGTKKNKRTSKKRTRKKRGGDLELKQIHVNDLNQDAVGKYFKFTTRSNTGVIKVFDGKFLGYRLDRGILKAIFRIIKPRGELYVRLGQFVEIFKYVAETDTDNHTLEFIFANPQQGGRRKKRTRKKRGGTKQCNICYNSHPQEDIIGCEHKNPDGSPLITNWYHKECLRKYWQNDNVPCTNDMMMGSVTNLINCDTPSKTFINKNLDKPNCHDIYQYGVEGANDLQYDRADEHNLPKTLEERYDKKYVTWIRRGWGENKNQIIMYNDKDKPFIYDDAGQEVVLSEKIEGQHHGGRKKKTRKYKGNKYPYKNITKKEAIADFIKLKTTTNPRSLNGLEIVNYGTEKLRVRTKYRGKSLIERWKDKKARKTLKKFANRLYKGSYTDSLFHAYRSAIALSWGTLSSMRTSAALQMYRKYNAKKVLDFTAGWGSRMTAALAADIDYIGIDTNKSLKKGYNKILKATKKHTKSKVKLFFQPAETVDYSKLDYDFVFTSPPYEYLELYEHMKNYEGTKKIKQAYSANDTKRKNDGFYDTFLIPTIKEIYKHLPKGKWICLNVPDLMYDKIKKKWKACDKKDDYMISKRVGSTMKAEDRRGQEFVYCWKK